MRLTESSLSLLVLCGGRGMRMGGVDKPLMSIDGRPMVEWVLAAGPSDVPVFISANRNTDRYSRYGEVFTDAEVGVGRGPLTGILGGLERCETDWLLVCPGDSPSLREGWYTPLLDQPSDFGAVIYDGERQQHLHILLRKTLAGALRRYLEEGNHHVWRWISTQPIAGVDSPHHAWFRNVNSKAELDAGR